MYQNRIWLIFLLLVAATALWFSGRAALQLYRYWSLGTEAKGEIVSWSVDHIGGDAYRLRGSYSYDYAEMVHRGESLLPKPLFRNQMAAKAYAEELPVEGWTIWVDRRCPGRSALSRPFPTKDLIYAVIMAAVAAYLYLLGRYVTRMAT